MQEQVNELRHMILMMTGQGEKEESNKESSGNVREKAGRKKVRMEEGVGFVDMWLKLCGKR